MGMHALGAVTVFAVLVLIGVELCVGVFVNPAARRLEPAAQKEALRLLAVSLGKAMPVCYGVCLALLVAEAVLRRSTPAFPPLVAAAGLWLLVILASVFLLVPINNRIAAGTAADWQEQHRRWDRLHRGRVLVLCAAAVLLVNTLVG